MTEPTDTYDTATYYAVRDPDELTWHEEWEAISDALDVYLEPGVDVEAVIRKLFHDGITVTGYIRGTISDAWFTRAAKRCAELLGELFDEDELLGNPDDRALTDAKEKAVADALLPVIREQVTKHMTPWHCNKCGARTYTADELIAMARENEPDWFVPAGGK